MHVVFQNYTNPDYKIRRILCPHPNIAPGYQTFKSLKSFVCKCPECGEIKEIFSDEFNKDHTCKKCGKPIDFAQCTLDGGA